jgi:hypothetical protein
VLSALLITLYRLPRLELAETRMRNEDECNTEAYTSMQWDSVSSETVDARGNTYKESGAEILTAVAVTSTINWDAMMYSLIEDYRCYGKKYRLQNIIF